MPSPEFMNRVLSTGRNDEVEDEVELPDPDGGEPPTTEELLPEESEPVEEGPSEEEEDDESPSAEGEEDQGEGDVEEAEEAEKEEEAEDSAQEEFFLGTYRTREEAEAGLLEAQQHISRQAEEMHQMRERQAQVEGYLAAQQQQQPAVEGEFEAWAEQYIESGNGWAGANEAYQAWKSQGDPSYVSAYIERWKESEPFEAARFANMVDSELVLQQQAAYEQSQPAPPQEVVNTIWREIAATDPELGQGGEYAQGVGKILVRDPGLNALAMSGNPDLVRSAVRIARDGYRMATGTGNGTPRKVKSSDAEKLREDKLAATVTTGDSSPDRRESTPEVAPELQDMMQRIAQGEGGFPKLRE